MGLRMKNEKCQKRFYAKNQSKKSSLQPDSFANPTQRANKDKN